MSFHSLASAASAAAPAARRGGSDSLEQLQNVVTAKPPGPVVGESLELVKCGCECWYCADCCRRKGYTLRARLIDRLKALQSLMMLTLTVDPLLFASPQAAYRYLRERRAISTLMQDLDRAGFLLSRHYFYVVEFQRETEQAHFHVLINATFVPKPVIDAVWSKHRPRAAGPPDPNRPALGMTRFSAPKFADALHAGRYATKYLVKTPEQGWPSWVLMMGKDARVPRYGTSRGFWGTPSEPATKSTAQRSRSARTYRERIADCGTACNVFRVGEHADRQTGEIASRKQFLARVGVAANLIPLIADPPTPTARRAMLKANGLADALGELERVAGHPVRVLAGNDPREVRP